MFIRAIKAIFWWDLYNTFNWVDFKRSAPSAAARRLRIFTLFVLAERPLPFDHCDVLVSEVGYWALKYLIPLTRALSAGLACSDHLCHSQPLIEARAHPSDLGQGFDVFDLLDRAFLTATGIFAACLRASLATFETFLGCDNCKSPIGRSLFSFDVLVAVHRTRNTENERTEKKN